MCRVTRRRAASLGLVGLLCLALAAGCTAGRTPTATSTAGGATGPDITVSGHRVTVPGLPAADDPWRVSCAARDFCALVDGTGLSWFWRGTAWTGPVRYAAAGHTAALVSCPSTTFCMASAAAGTYVWNGTAWAATPGAAWAGDVLVLACAGPAYCLAGPAAGGTTGLRAWRGTTWSAAPEVDSYASLGALGCARDGDTCAVLGQAINVHHGGAWHDDSFFPKDTALDVSCAAGGVCMAAVHNDYAIWRDGAWSERPLRYGIQLGEVACASATFCLGTDRESVAVWNGTEWSPGPELPSTAQGLLLDVAGGFPSCPVDGWCMLVAPGVAYTFSE